MTLEDRTPVENTCPAITPRISAGGIVFRDGKILLVRLRAANGGSFWIPPGGGMEPGEGALACAEREVFEETGVRVKGQRVLYVQELTCRRHYHAKFWVLCQDLGGEITRDHLVPDEVNDLLEARFVNRDELKGMDVVPPIVVGQLWEDLANDFQHVRYIAPYRVPDSRS